MKKEERTLRCILGPSRKGILPMAAAINEMSRLLFEEGLPIDSIRVTSSIYPAVAKQTGKSVKATARQIQRTCNLLWDLLDEEQKLTFIGRPVKDIGSTKDVLFYLAFYCHYNESFYYVIEKEPQLIEERLPDLCF